MKVAKKTLKKLAILANFIACSGLLIKKLLWNIRLLKNADVIVFMPEGGFGHTIMIPDIMRRLFKNKRQVFIMLSEYRRHNGKTALIWPELSSLHIPLSLGVRVKNKPYALPGSNIIKIAATKIVQRFVKLIAKKDQLFFDSEALYKKLISEYRAPPAPEHLAYTVIATISYFRLITDMPASKVFLPVPLRQEIKKRIDNKIDFKRAKRCGLYLRRKGEGADLNSQTRRGSPPEDYELAIRTLIEHGYQVLVTGDALLGSHFCDQLQGWLIEAATIGVEKDLFDVYVATESDLFIADPGGGAWLPGVNEIPRLLINAFPYSYGMPRATVHYKTVRTSDGKLVPLEKLFKEHSWDWTLEGMILCDNKKEEIAAAVEEFIENHSKASNIKGEELVLKLCPHHTWVRETRSRISPVFLSHYSH